MRLLFVLIIFVLSCTPPPPRSVMEPQQWGHYLCYPDTEIILFLNVLQINDSTYTVMDFKHSSRHFVVEGYDSEGKMIRLAKNLANIRLQRVDPGGYYKKPTWVTVKRFVVQNRKENL